MCKGGCLVYSVHRRQINELTISLRFLGMILRVVRLEVSAYNVYITNLFEPTFAQRRGGGVKLRPKIRPQDTTLPPTFYINWLFLSERRTKKTCMSFISHHFSLVYPLHYRQCRCFCLFAFGLLKRFTNTGSVKEPRNRFPAWRAGTTTLFDVPARQAT
jgi:hypothetical protein